MEEAGRIAQELGTLDIDSREREQTTSRRGSESVQAIGFIIVERDRRNPGSRKTTSAGGRGDIRSWTGAVAQRVAVIGRRRFNDRATTFEVAPTTFRDDQCPSEDQSEIRNNCRALNIKSDSSGSNTTSEWQCGRVAC